MIEETNTTEKSTASSLLCYYKQLAFSLPGVCGIKHFMHSSAFSNEEKLNVGSIFKSLLTIL